MKGRKKKRNQRSTKGDRSRHGCKLYENRTKGGKNEGVRMAMIGLQGLNQKIKIMREKRRLKERKLRIDDLTWTESKMRWNLENIARRERGEGKRVQINYRKI